MRSTLPPSAPDVAREGRRDGTRGVGYTNAIPLQIGEFRPPTELVHPRVRPAARPEELRLKPIHPVAEVTPAGVLLHQCVDALDEDTNCSPTPRHRARVREDDPAVGLASLSGRRYERHEDRGGHVAAVSAE
jgi:hypothetical protein